MIQTSEFAVAFLDVKLLFTSSHLGGHTFIANIKMIALLDSLQQIKRFVVKYF